jgi:hypothetical protein
MEHEKRLAKPGALATLLGCSSFDRPISCESPLPSAVGIAARKFAVYLGPLVAVKTFSLDDPTYSRLLSFPAGRGGLEISGVGKPLQS